MMGKLTFGGSRAVRIPELVELLIRAGPSLQSCVSLRIDGIVCFQDEAAGGVKSVIQRLEHGSSALLHLPHLHLCTNGEPDEDHPSRHGDANFLVSFLLFCSLFLPLIHQRIPAACFGSNNDNLEMSSR